MKKGRKIVFVSHSLGRGGAERILVKTANQFATKGYTVKVYIRENSKNSLINDLVNVDVIEIKSSGTLGFMIQLNKVIKIERPTFVYGFLGYINIILGFLKMFHKEIVFVGRENAVYKEYLKNKSIVIKKMYIFFASVFLGNLDLIIAQSNYMKNDLLSYLKVKTRVIVLNNPLSDLNDKKSIIASDNIHLIAVGRLEPVKNFMEMLEIVKDLPDNYLLTIVGDGTLRKKLQQKVQLLGLDERIFFVGNQVDPSILMRKSNLLLLTSVRESYPNVALEATANSLYTISYASPGGINEILFEDYNGKIVDYGNRKLFRLAIVDNYKREAIVPPNLIKESTYFKKLNLIFEELINDAII